MQTKSTQQELLLVTTTTLLARNLCDRGDPDSNKRLSPAEQLEDACWNGLLEELLPEILQHTPSGKKLFLWHIRPGKTFLHIEMSEFPLEVDKRFSIDSSFFLPTLAYN